MAIDLGVNGGDGETSVGDVVVRKIVQVVVKDYLVADSLRTEQHVEHECAVVDAVSVVKSVDRLIGGQEVSGRSEWVERVFKILVSRLEGLVCLVLPKASTQIKYLIFASLSLSVPGLKKREEKRSFSSGFSIKSLSLYHESINT